ncbi:MAG TPA: hypothetical protein VIJ18_01245 [Microbacteriaceae bacterium]
MIDYPQPESFPADVDVAIAGDAGRYFRPRLIQCARNAGMNRQSDILRTLNAWVPGAKRAECMNWAGVHELGVNRN